MESVDTKDTLAYCRLCYPSGPRTSDPYNRIPLDRHMDKVNLSYVDGHVSSLKARKLIPVALPPSGSSDRVELERLWGHRLD
jgi:prepilin-type processing-associated H-X9-DG protein